MSPSCASLKCRPPLHLGQASTSSNSLLIAIGLTSSASIRRTTGCARRVRMPHYGDSSGLPRSLLALGSPVVVIEKRTFQDQPILSGVCPQPLRDQFKQPCLLARLHRDFQP